MRSIPEGEPAENNKGLGVHAYLFADWNEKSSCSSHDPENMKVFYNCRDGTFKPIDQYDMADDQIIDLTGLDFSSKVDRDWAWDKCVRENAPRLMVASTKCGSLDPTDQRLHREWTWLLAQRQADVGKSFIVCQEDEGSDWCSH